MKSKFKKSMKMKFSRYLETIKFPKLFKKRGLSEIIFIVIAFVVISITIFAVFS